MTTIDDQIDTHRAAVLAALGEGNATLPDIASASGVPLYTVACALINLVADGKVARDFDPDNDRVMVFSLTPGGDGPTPREELLAKIMSASFGLTRATSTALIETLTAQLDTERATVTAIRRNVGRLLHGPYMPMPDTIREALWPTDAEIDLNRPLKESS